MKKKKNFLASLSLGLMFSIVLMPSALAYNTLTYQALLSDNLGQSGDNFGKNVDIAATNSDYAVVGATQEDSTGFGKVVMYSRSGTSWTKDASFGAGAPTGLGSSVAISDDGVYAVAGAPYDSSGSVTVYKRTVSSWTEAAFLIPSDGQPGALFGISVDINATGDVIVVGALSNDEMTPNGGAFYVYTRSGETWSEYGTGGIYDNTPGLDEYLGLDVAISPNPSGGTYYIGASSLEGTGGAVKMYSFNGSTVSYVQALTKSSPVAGDDLGTSIDVSDGGTYVVASVPGYDGAASGAGGAVVFYKAISTWAQQQVLTASDAAINDNLGFENGSTSMNNDGDYIVVGGKTANAVYVFDRSGATWTQQQIITPQNSGGQFGISTATSGPVYTIVGDIMELSLKGAVEVFYDATSVPAVPGVPEFSTYLYILTLLVGFGFVSTTLKREKVEELV